MVFAAASASEDPEPARTEAVCECDDHSYTGVAVAALVLSLVAITMVCAHAIVPWIVRHRHSNGVFFAKKSDHSFGDGDADAASSGPSAGARLKSAVFGKVPAYSRVDPSPLMSDGGGTNLDV